ncbi:MAG: thiamine pyrophosphate-binding protein, partial [Dehalococcoidia bacterium]|nr:thiamine pyrophosphate-binding protein [Dehalococcoidia bacterium]
MTKTSDRICDVLIEAGIDHVFGIPGGGTMPIWDALFDRQDRIRVVLTRHEQSAACMADMYGRMTGRPGVLIGQGAFIASSGGFGILEGYLSNSPMLVLADTSDSGFSQHGNYQSGSGEYGSFDIVGILRSMSKYTTYAVTPGEAVQGIQLAIKHAMAGGPGPSCVVMRNNAISGEIDLEGVPKIYATSGYLKESLITPPAEDIEKASRLLLEAQRPVVIAGNGVHISRA